MKNAYHMVLKSNAELFGESSTTSNPMLLRKAIWHMKVPHKVRFFTSRACKDGLLCLQNLQVRNVPIENSYVLCRSPIKDASHALFYRPDVKVWWYIYLPFTWEAGQ